MNVSKNKKQTVTEINYNSIPKSIELFGRTVETIDDSTILNVKKLYGEARYGTNVIAISNLVGDRPVTDEEIKLTYLHEMMHFILNFTGFQEMILENKKIDLEQFVELMSAGIYQYEKSAQY